MCIKAIMKKANLILLVMVMFISICLGLGIGKAYAAAPTGNGSSTSPYLISTAADLKWISENISTVKDKKFLQVNDIDCTGVTFEPIGTNNDPFEGSYNGNGRTISNLNISSLDTTLVTGLFGRIESAGVVEHVTLKDTTIKGNSTGTSLVGGIAGQCFGTVKYCGVTGSTTIEAVSNIAEVGGIIGDQQTNSISNCYSTATVKGIAGAKLGGIVGYTSNASIQNCYFTGTFAGAATDRGGIIANLWSVSSETNNFFLDTSTTYGNGSVANNSGATPKTIAELQTEGTYTDWKFDYDWCIAAGSTPQHRMGAPDSSQITTTSAATEVTVAGVPGDIIRMYDSATGGNLLGTGTVALGQSSVTIDLTNLYSYTKIYLSRATSDKLEGQRKEHNTPTLILEGFENLGNIPANWDTSIDGNFKWSGSAGGACAPEIDPVAVHGGSYMAEANCYSSNAVGKTARLYTKDSFPIPAVGSYECSFWMYHYPDVFTDGTGTYGPEDKVQLQINVDGAGWTNVGSEIKRVQGTTQDWVQHTIPLPDCGGKSVQIGLWAYSDFGYNIYIDDVRIARSSTTYSIETIDNQTLNAVVTGYTSGTQETREVTITQSGTGDLANLKVAVSGDNADSFTITQPEATTLNSTTPTTKFTVKANDGLATGTYTAKVTVSATYMKDADFTVTQTINPVVPTTQASTLTFSNLMGTGMTINWTNGNGSSRAVFVKVGNGDITNPSDSSTYTASADWLSKGTQLGASGYYCVYNGTGSSVSLTNLSPGTSYTVQVFEYNGSAGSEKYLTTTATGNPNAQTTHLVTYKGTQKRTNGSNYDIRFIATINTLEPDSVGFVYSTTNTTPIIGGSNTQQVDTTTVYNSIIANGETKTAAGLGGTYIIACPVTAVSNDSTFYLRAYTTTGSETVYTAVFTVTVSGLS
ncbi:MAG: GLUG motif-containing protein [Chitinophagales bacterium]